MAHKLIVGNVVKLKSGGPWMTVTKDRTEQSNKLAQTAWFDGAILMTEFFPKDALDIDPASIQTE
jgi:uncharacterized protein YodC (DUF2158 family)